MANVNKSILRILKETGREISSWKEYPLSGRNLFMPVLSPAGSVLLYSWSFLRACNGHAGILIEAAVLVSTAQRLGPFITTPRGWRGSTLLLFEIHGTGNPRRRNKHFRDISEVFHQSPLASTAVSAETRSFVACASWRRLLVPRDTCTAAGVPWCMSPYLLRLLR